MDPVNFLRRWWTGKPFWTADEHVLLFKLAEAETDPSLKTKLTATARAFGWFYAQRRGMLPSREED